MILTCPECASRYFVDDARVGPQGRTVRCASCAHSWRALPETAIGDAESPLPAAPSPAALSDVVHETTEQVPFSPGRTAPLPKRIRAEALEKKKTREAVTAGVIWAGLGAGFVGVVLAAVLFRVDVVRLWPQAAGAYAFAKMPVNPTGLSLETVQGQPNLINGHAALSISGVERNVETRPVASMPLRVVLFDKGGKRLTSIAYVPPRRELAPGDTRPFAVNFIDPPAEGSSFVVEFAFDKVKGQAVTPVQTKPVAAKLAGRAPPTAAPAALPIQAPIQQARDAKPLPDTSPFALPAAASQQTTR